MKLLLVLIASALSFRLRESTCDGNNALGTELQPCGNGQTTGFLRDNCCHYDEADGGLHTVCAELSQDFLDYTNSQGNNLDHLGAGTNWCVCSGRWNQANAAGHAPPVVLEATNEHALDKIELETLKQHKAD